MRKFLFVLFFVITLIPSIAYLASCLTPYVSPVHFWPMAFLALAFPYLAAVILALAFIWVFVRKKIALGLLLLFFFGYQNLFSTLALGSSEKSVTSKDTGSLRVLTWNVRGFDNPSITPDSATSVRTQMLNYISKVNPDVLCLQEFVEHDIPGTFSNTASLHRLGYIYIYKTNETIHRFNYGSLTTSSAIFSKIPLIDSGKVMLGDPSYPGYLAYADIQFQKKTARIFATHFKSINLFAAPTDTSNPVVFYGDSNFIYQSTKFEKLKAFGQAHSREAIIAKEAIDKSPFPVIVGVDMNSVPTSYPYHRISAGIQDAFKLNGWGFGTTIRDLPKTLRIDYLFADKELEIKSFYKDELLLSDHYPQFVDLTWQK